jgi:hypothetical protein
VFLLQVWLSLRVGYPVAFNSSVAVLICPVTVMNKQWILTAKVYNMKQNFPLRHQIVVVLLLLCHQQSSKICICAQLPAAVSEYTAYTVNSKNRATEAP